MTLGISAPGPEAGACLDFARMVATSPESVSHVSAPDEVGWMILSKLANLVEIVGVLAIVFGLLRLR